MSPHLFAVCVCVCARLVHLCMCICRPTTLWGLISDGVTGSPLPPSALSLFLPIFPQRPPPSNPSPLTQNTTAQHRDNQQIAQSRWKRYQIYPHSNTHTKRHTRGAANKAVCSRVQGQGIALRTEGRIPFHLSDPYVSYLEGCNGTQLGWNQDELIN